MRESGRAACVTAKRVNATAKNVGGGGNGMGCERGTRTQGLVPPGLAF